MRNNIPKKPEFVDKRRDPIAVVDKHGHVLPFVRNNVDRMYFMMADCTYIWDLETLHKTVEHNNTMLENANYNRVLHGAVLPALPSAPRDPLDGEQVAAAFFNASMLTAQ